jgi:4-hydroxy-tetrahydrodipicolinate reductase
MIKIALLGYGNMGQEVANVVSQSKNHQIVSISHKRSTDSLDKAGIMKADVVIDFTSADAVLLTIKEVAALQKNLVIGTTGWYDRLDEVKSIVKKSGIGLIYGQNFSIGANIFFKIISYASSLVSQFEEYDVYGFEIHHKMKKDSPSATAKKLSQIIQENMPVKKLLQPDRVERQIAPEELHFASIRGGYNPGFHEVIFDSLADEIRLTHAARGRRGFAEGAVMAAEFIRDKKGIYSFDELFSEK